MLSADWPDEQTARALQVADLAIAILFELDYHDGGSLLNRGNFLNFVVDDEQHGWRKGGRIVTGSVYVPGAGRQQRDELKAMVGRAWDWLVREDLIGPDPSQGRRTDFVQITPRGRETLARPRNEALAMAKAVSALNHPLHERLQRVGVDADFRAGRLDVAIRNAFRDVEHVVRGLSGLTAASPVPLMEQAFAANAGALADQQAPTPQQHARQRLFMGAFGRYRNAPNHTYVAYDPGEAVEIVLLASLLMRELDDVGRRVGTMPVDVP